MKTKIIPRGKYILIKPEGPEDRVGQYGLVMPSNVEQEQKAQGTVMAVGAEVIGIDKGDRVIFGAYAGEVIKLGEGGKQEELKLVHDDDVIARIE